MRRRLTRILCGVLLGGLTGAPPATAADPPAIVAPTLEALPAAAPVPGARRDVVRAVIVQFTVTEAGAVTDATVVRGPGPPWDAAALARIGGARFVPGTRDGAPYPFTLTAPVQVGTRQITWQARPRRRAEEVPRAPEGISGIILERGTRRPIAGQPVVLGDGARETVTDAEGRFRFLDVARGDVTLTVPGFDHAPLERVVAPPADLTLRLTPEPQRSYRTVVRNPTSETGRLRIPVERAREIPGSAGDPLKVIESLPGVARPAGAGPNSGQISVRGSAPEDTAFYVDGMPLLQLYHFGAIYSVLQDEWIQDVDFRPEGGGVAYGDATGGLLGVTLAPVPDDGVHGHLDVNIYHVAALVTAPIGDEWAVGAAFRRSWVDAIFVAVLGDDSGLSATAVPRYYDYQARADWRPPGGRTSLRLLAFGSDDSIGLLLDAPDADGTAQSFGLRRFFHQLQGRLSHALSDTLTLEAGIATSYQRLELRPGSESLQLTFDPVTLRADLLWRATPDVRVRGGIFGEITRFDVQIDIQAPPKEGQVAIPGEAREIFTGRESGITEQLALWAETLWDVSPTVSLEAGMRLNTWFGTFESAAPDGRLAALWTPSDTWRVSASVGLSHQQPAADEWSETIGNPDLEPERAFSATVGVGYRLGDVLSVDVSGFYKALDDLVSPTVDRDAPPYDNAGTGQVIGGEVLVRLAADRFDGWVAYTLSRSTRVDRPGDTERLFSFDQTHVLAVVAGVDLGARWRVGARFRYTTGGPFTPLEAAYYDATSDVFVPRASAGLLSRRTQAFLQLDVRLDKTFVFDDWQLKVYLELNNTTNRRNTEFVSYSEDYAERDDVESLPITPSLGFRGSF